MAANKLKILLVDDEAELTATYAEILQEKYETICAISAEAALPLIDLHASELACILSDFKMGGMNGLDLCREMSKKHKDIPFILLSAYISREDALAAIDAKISAFESKPFDSQKLFDLVIRIAAERESSIQERLILEQTFIEESTSICDELEPLIMSLETNPSDIEVINTIFRLVHTIKGSSGVLESSHIRSYVHKYEDLLSKLKNGTVHAKPEIVSILLQGLDVVSRMINHLRTGTVWTQNIDDLIGIFDISNQSPPPPGSEKGSHEVAIDTIGRGTAKETVAVPTLLLDEFMEQSGEITVIRNMVNKLVRAIEKEQPGNKNVQQLSVLLDEMHQINGGCHR